MANFKFESNAVSHKNQAQLCVYYKEGISDRAAASMLPNLQLGRFYCFDNMSWFT